MSKKIKLIFLALLLILLIIGGLWINSALKDPQIFPLKKVQIKDTYQHINSQTIQQAIAAYVTNGFFSVDVDGIKQQLLQLPWVYSVSVNRVWPDQIVINIVEQTAIARWNNDSLLNVDGKIFTPTDKSTLPDDLPALFGPDDRIEQIWDYYQQMNQTLSFLGLQITGMGLNANSSWRLILNNGINVILGNVDIMKRFYVFVKAYPKIIGARGDKVANIDLRYSNGLAIKWKHLKK